jgi:hypothetical protein
VTRIKGQYRPRLRHRDGTVRRRGTGRSPKPRPKAKGHLGMEGMISSARYLARAFELEGMAVRAADPATQHQWRSMAASYRRLAALLDAKEEPEAVPLATGGTDRA